MRAYLFDDVEGDQRLAHDSGVPVASSDLNGLGVLHWHTDDLDEVNRVAEERGYKNRDEINVSEAAMADQYIPKITGFFREHLHEDEEIRWIRDGAGYFDIRDRTDKRWVRIRVEKGDLLVLPPGIYHRFTLDDTNYIKAMRLFKDEPKWVPHDRSQQTETNPLRHEYLSRIGIAA